MCLLYRQLCVIGSVCVDMHSEFHFCLPLLLAAVAKELYRVVRQPAAVPTGGPAIAFLSNTHLHSDVKSDVARLVTLGEPRAITFAVARLVSYFRVHGLEPMAVFDHTGDVGAEELKAANAAQSNNRSQNGRHTVERILAGVAGSADRENAEANQYTVLHNEPRLTQAETIVCNALDAAECAVVASQGEADLVVERLAASFTGPLTVLTSDTDALCVAHRGGWDALRIVRAEYLPWQQLLSEPTLPHSVTGTSADTAALLAHEGAALRVAHAHPLRYLTPARFAHFVSTRVPGFVPSLLHEFALLCGTDYTKDLPAQRDVRRATGVAVHGGMQPLDRFFAFATWATHKLLLPSPPSANDASPRVRRLEDWLASANFRMPPDLVRGMAYSRQRFAGKVLPLEEGPIGNPMLPSELRNLFQDGHPPPAALNLWRALLLAPRPQQEVAGSGSHSVPLSLDALGAMLTGMRGVKIGRERFETPLTTPDGVCTASLLRPIYAAEQALFVPQTTVIDAIVDREHRNAVSTLLGLAPRAFLFRAMLRSADADVELVLPVQPAPPVAVDRDDVDSLATSFAHGVVVEDSRTVGAAAGASPDAWPSNTEPDLSVLLPIARLRLSADVNPRDDAFAAITDVVAGDYREAYCLEAVDASLYDASLTQHKMLQRLSPLINPTPHAGVSLMATARAYARAGKLAEARRAFAVVIAGRTVRHMLATAARAAVRLNAHASAAGLPTTIELCVWVAVVALLLQEDAIECADDAPADAPPVPIALPARPVATLTSMRQATVASFLHGTAGAFAEVASTLGICRDAVRLRVPSLTSDAAAQAPLPAAPSHRTQENVLPAVPASLLFDGPRFLCLYSALVPLPRASVAAGGCFAETYPSGGTLWSVHSPSGVQLPMPTADISAALQIAWRTCSMLRAPSEQDIGATVSTFINVWCIACSDGMDAVAQTAMSTLAQKCRSQHIHRTLPAPATGRPSGDARAGARGGPGRGWMRGGHGGRGRATGNSRR